MERLLALRELVLKELEKAREAKLIGNSLEAEVRLRASAEDTAFLARYEKELSTLFIVSSVVLEPSASGKTEVKVGRAPGEKCQRCWNYSPYVGQSRDHPQLCRRCEDVVRAIRR